MSHQHLKLSKNSQSAAVASKHDGKKEPQLHSAYTDHEKLGKGKSEVQTFQKKLQRRDLNLIPPSAAIVQKVAQQSGMNERGGYQLTLNSTQNKNRPSGMEHLDPTQSRVTTVKHEKGLPNGTIMQCLKQFQRSKQQRSSNHATVPPDQPEPVTGKSGSICLQTVMPVASQNVANMPISSKSNKSSKARNQGASNASMAAEAHAARRQNFTCTTTTKGSLRLTKKSPSNGRDQNAMISQNRILQPRDRSQNSKQTSQSNSYQMHKGTRGSSSQQPGASDKMSRPAPKAAKKQADVLLQDMDMETKFAMLMRIREERSNESKPENGVESQKLTVLTHSNNPYEPVKLVQPNTTTNRHSSQDAKLLTLKHFQPAKQVSSSVVTPKYLKCKLGSDKAKYQADEEQQTDSKQQIKQTSKSQISTHKIQKTRDQRIYGTQTQGTCSPEGKGQQAKSLSNNSRQRFASQQTGQQYPQSLNSNVPSKSVKASASRGSQNLNLKMKSGGSSAVQPSAPQMRYSVPPDSKSRYPDSSQGMPNAVSIQAQQQMQGSNSALNGSSELQKRFTRGEIGSHNDQSVNSGKANKSFQFGHNTALVSCSSGGDSSNPPQKQPRRRSSSGKNGKQTVKLSHIQNINPVIMEPGLAATSVSATNRNLRNTQNAQSNSDNSYINLRKNVPQSTTNTHKTGQHFTFTLNPRDAQKASRPNKHSNPSTTKNASLAKNLTSQAYTHQTQAPPASSISATNKSATKTKSVSAKKGKVGGKEAGSAAQKNLTFDKVGRPEEPRNGKNFKVKTPEDMWYDSAQPAIVPNKKARKIVHQIPTHPQDTGPPKTKVKRAEKHAGVKQSEDSTPNSSLIQAQGNGQKSNQEKARLVTMKQRMSSEISMSHGEIGARDSIIEESSQSGSAQAAEEEIHSNERFEEVDESYQERVAQEMQMKDDLIRQLQKALGRKEEQLNALTKNCEALSTSLKSRDEKRDKSQQAIKETLKNLEHRLLMFTAQSEHNQGGLRQITQSPCEAKRINDQHLLARKNYPIRPTDTNLGGLPPDQAQFLANQVVNQTPLHPSKRLAKHPVKQQQRPASSTLITNSESKLASPNATGRFLEVERLAFTNRRPSQISEIDSLVTVAEYLGTQYEYSVTGDVMKSSATPHELPTGGPDGAFPGEGTIGSLASEIQLITNRNTNEASDKATYPLFRKQDGNGEAEDLGEMTSVSEMEMSNVHDASLDQLERDLMETQQKLQDQSQKASAFVKTQQNNFLELKANLKVADEKHVILEDTEEAEDDAAHFIAQRKAGSSLLMSHTQKLNYSKVTKGATRANHQEPRQAVDADGPGTEQLNSYRQSETYKSVSMASNQASLNSYSNKLSKTLSKNKMKLKLASDILGSKKGQLIGSEATIYQQPQHQHAAQQEGDIRSEERASSKEVQRQNRRKIQLPLKIQKGFDQNRKDQSQEGVQTLSNHSANGQQQTQFFNSVTIRNLKGGIKPSNTTDEDSRSIHAHAIAHSTSSGHPNSFSNFGSTSPPARQGVQVQGQGNMLSNRLAMKNVKEAKQGMVLEQPSVQKIDKLSVNQMILARKQIQGHKAVQLASKADALHQQQLQQNPRNKVRKDRLQD